MIPLDEARLRILEACEPLPGEPAPLGDAQGRRLVSPVMARHPYPNADVSAMDGYALRASDAAAVGARLSVTGESRAGAPFTGALGAGEAIRIFT
ncbi:MAG TPA: molybdopterin molybdenumtransferase MoeA, partial [Deltaproteobacteria bacterium]|nr:molybdopterin molybdenumtransferase MoeA [Deltaproteobacteria bacterium]